MVFKSTNYRSDSFGRLKELRKAGSLCDVTLTVDQHAFKAHCCVLVAGSQYFNSLFLGQFKEASTQNIDLSEVTTDVKALEHVLDFLYAGEIDIDDDNLEILVKLSTYLVIDHLRKLCMEYIRGQLNLKTCLRYCLFAASYGLTWIEREAKLYLTSRLHDSYKVILEENLELSPDDVSYLLKNDIFQHCTAVSTLYFVSKWLTDSVTDQHTMLASQILDTVDLSNVLLADPGYLSEQLKSESLEVLARIQETEQNNNSCDAENLMEKMRKLLEKVFPELKLENKVYNLRAGPSSAKKRKVSLGKARPESSRRNQCEDVEAVIVTISPRQCAVDADSKGQTDEMFVSHTEPVLSLCCYTPKTKTWYHIMDFETEAFMDPILNDLGISNIRSALFEEELVLMVFDEHKVYFYNLRTNSLRETALPDTDTSDSQDNTYYGGRCACLVTSNNALFLIVDKTVYRNENCKHEGQFFVGLKFDGQTWMPAFETSIEKNMETSYSELQAKVSSVSNELIFAQSSHGYKSNNCEDVVYIVNLNEESPIPVKVYKEHSLVKAQRPFGLSILESQSHFYVLFEKVDACLIYKYGFNSLDCDNREIKVKSFFKKSQLYSVEDDDYFSTICFTNLTLHNGKNALLYEGDKYSISCLHELEVTENRQVTSRDHTPPPFSSVTAMAAGELPRDLLDQMTHSPVQEFFHRDREAGRQETAET